MDGEDTEIAFTNCVDTRCDYCNFNSHSARRIIGELDELLNENNVGIIEILQSTHAQITN